MCSEILHDTERANRDHALVPLINPHIPPVSFIDISPPIQWLLRNYIIILKQCTCLPVLEWAGPLSGCCGCSSEGPDMFTLSPMLGDPERGGAGGGVAGRGVAGGGVVGWGGAGRVGNKRRPERKKKISYTHTACCSTTLLLEW